MNFKSILLLISVLLFLGGLNFTSAQSISKKHLINQQSLSTSFQASQDFYNPWTIHKKISAFGLAGTMAATFVGALAMDDEYLGTTVIPVVGPFITIARVEDDPFGTYQSGGKSLLTASGVVQSAFLVYFVTSIIGESNYKGRHQASNLRISPTPISKGVGVSLNMNF